MVIMWCSTLVCVGTSLSGRPAQLSPARPILSFRFPLASRLIMASFGASSADAAAWADFAAAAGLDVVAHTTSPTAPTTSSPGVEAEPAEEPPSGPPAEGLELAAPPAPGGPALVEPTAAEEDIAPPVMGVPSSRRR